MLTRPEAAFPLALQVRSSAGAPIGDVFAFLSGLYFRGKLTYARAFAPDRAFVITPCDGLFTLEQRITIDTIRRFAEVDIHHEDERFRGPLLRDAMDLDDATGGAADAILLGSIASKKYVEVLGSVFGERLLFPEAFVGRGDMSRGGLLLRAAREGKELDYAPVIGAVRRGKRPPKLVPIRGILKDSGG
ncbi:MAG: hypothetical protein HOW73_29315 [Polyangiaceae bacterium]|nr:hypothetical protein [Polyangiaceae bacterium]